MRSLLFALVSVVGVGCTTSDVEPVTDDSGELDQDTSVPFTVEQTDELIAGGRLVGALASSSPDTVTGARLDEDGTLVVAIPFGSDERALRTELTRAGITGVAVRFQYVRHSRREMEKVQHELLDRLAAGDPSVAEIMGVGLDPSRGVVTVYVSGHATERARVELRREFGDAIVFRPGDVFKGTSRNLDTSPHIGGAGYHAWDGGHHRWGIGCSTAFPVDVYGSHYMLTAGHCLPVGTPFTSLWAANYTGTSSTTYFFGNPTGVSVQNLAGDWALMEGATYKARVYNTNSSAVDVAAVDWGAPSINEQVCLSGMTTGKVCRLVITDTDYAGPVDSKTIGTLAVYKSDQNLDGVGDCSVGDHGDSGGAIFQWVGSKFRAMGIATAISGSADETTESYTTTCTDDRGAYTKLTALKNAYNSNVTMPVLP